MTDISQLAWEYFAVSVPVVVIFSPIGAFVSSHLHRQVLATFVYVLETAAVIGFLFTAPPLSLIVAGGVIILVGWVNYLDANKLNSFSSLFFFSVSYLGKRLCNQIESREMNIHDMSTTQQQSTVSSTYDLAAQ